ncbi:HIT family protein [Lysobacter sp. 1R34A]|uniref:HIT family protein n=1 Tax=Lysobacter sp. 1R34A TaxID=3445786 RepID=UPI003EEA7F82
MSDCIFCAILAGRAPASRVYEDEVAVAFMDLRQAVEGHVLVVPREHIEDIYALDEATAGHLMAIAVRIAKALAAEQRPAGLNLWQSNGEAGGQEVAHVHLHVQPRRPHDGVLRLYRDGLPAPADRCVLDRLAARIARHL